MTSLIDDETATRYYNEIDTAPEEERQQMADALLAWGEEKQSREREETDTHFSKLFTDDSYYQQVNDNDPSLAEALDPDATAKRASIHAYLEHQLARPIDAANYEPERDAFAMANYGKKNLDDGQLFEAIRGTYDFQRQRTEAINDLHVQSVGKALADTNLGVNRPFVEGMTGVFNEWQQKYPELVDGKEDAAYLAQAYKLYYDTINDLDAVRPIAGKTLSTLDAFTKGNASGEDLQSLAQTLAQATPEDRDRVYKYVTLGAQAGQIDRAGIEQFAINLGQSFSRGFDFIPQGSLQQMESGVESFLNGIRNGSQVWVPSSGDLTKAVVGNASPDAAAKAAQEGAWRQASVGETETLIASANDAMQTFQVVRELRNVAKTGVDPIRPVMEKGSVMGAVEGGAYGVAGSIGFLGATAINPFLGVAAYQANEYDRIRLENPDMDIRAAQGLALVEGTWQAALDRVQLATLSGKLPVLGRFLGNIENNGIRRTLKVGASVAEQFGQELAQDTGTIVIDNIAAALREDMPDKDFAAEMAKYGEQIPETLAASVMFGLVGGGFATAADLGVTEQQMKIVGINDKKIARIKQATSPEEADALIQSALESRTSEDIEAGKTYARQVFNEAQNPSPESPRISLVAGQDGTDEYLVTAPDGSEMLRTKSQQAAMEAVRQDAESKLLTERNTVRDMVDYFRAQDPTNEATIEAPRTVQQELDRLTEAGDAKGIANLNERIRFAGIPEGADLTAYNILGEANVETTAEGVFKGVIRLRENSRPEDAFEEINHVFVRKALAEGRTNLDSLRGWLQQTSEATGETYATETETDIIENIAKVGMDYAAGRIEETSLPASFVDYIKRMLQVLKETMARAIKLKDAFATGKIDSNFESFLAESVGLNQQTMVETTRERASGDIITDGGQMLMDFSIGSRSNAVSTDTPSIRASNATITGPANYSIGAFHGTPHKVDKFSTAKIGTGEGAQAYGWGLYFAGNQKVAKGYKDKLQTILYDGKTINPDDPLHVALSTLRFNNNDRQKSADFLRQRALQMDFDLNTKAAELIEKGESLPAAQESGNLYTVDLDVEPEDLLDWDKPFSEQSPKVQAAIKAATADIWKSDKSEYDGSVVYNGLVEDLRNFDKNTAEKMASERLLAAGIPGIRYLDGDSRNSQGWKITPPSETVSGKWMVKSSDYNSKGLHFDTEAEAKTVLAEKIAGQTYNYVVFDENLIKITEENGNRIPASQALAAPATSATNYSIGKKQSAGGIRFDEITKEDPKHDGSRVGTAWQGKVKPTTQQTNDGIATIKPNELEKQMAMLTQFVDGVPLPKYITKFKDAQKRMRAFLDFQKGNLLALYDAFNALSADFVIRSTHWYDGARLLAEGVRDNYRLTIEQSSAIIAVFSPMKDWFQNVAMGQRFADVMANHKNKKITKANMGEAMREMLDAAEDDRKIRKAFKQIEGRSISQLLKDKSKEGRTIAAVAVRLMSTNVHGLTHDVLSPEGESLGIRKNLDGTNKKLVWQSYTFIEKAISIYEDGSAKNISKVLGTEHKIRNFYNNIVAPTSPFGDATVDTHAVNAAVLYPMGNKGYLVGLNFGNAGVAGGGNSGIYWLFHEALREAAKERGVMPRQMQSITWEAIRGLFTDIRKRDKNFVAGITKIWETSSNADAARTQIIGLGITPPEWARVGSSNSGGEGGMRSSTGQVADSAGSVQSGIRQGRQGGDRRAGVNYSIASQSEIDRVNKALGGMNRGPDERLKVYERAKQKFSKLMAWNSDELGAMADTGSDETQIRRTQLLQGLGELDAILQVLPPEVRGRVGGYTKLANIAPMDVFKDGVKVSEAKNMTGAIISAWMKEGQNIGQAGKQVSLPPGYTAKENLASKRADKSLADFFRDRIKKIDIELEKVIAREYRGAILDLVKKSRPKAGDNNVRKSTLGPETQKLADLVQRATMMDEDAVAERMLQLEQSMQSSEDNSALVEEWGILNTFGDLSNRNSETLAQAHAWFRDQLKAGREAWRIKEEARIAENRERAKKTVEWVGGATAQDRFRDKTLIERMGDWANNLLLDHASFEQFVNALLPPEIAADFSTRLRKADVAAQKTEIDQREGILNALRAGAKAAGTTTGKALESLKTEIPSSVRYLDGRKVKNTKLTIEQSEKIVRGEIDRGDLTDTDVRNLADELAALPADTRKENITLKQVVYPGKEVKLPMTRGKAIQLLLSWNQPDVRDKMKREGWTDDSIVDLQELTSDPVSQAMLAHAQELYGKGYGVTNPVYARMFGMNMPQAKNYAPTRFNHSKDVKDVGLDGSPVATGTTPGFAKSRVSHSAKIAPEDALSVMQQHILAQSHWVNFAELAREFRSLITNPEVRESIKQKHGQAVLKTAELWADQMEQRGGNQSREAAWVNNILGSVIGGQSVASLGFNLKTLAMQLDNAVRFGLALDMKQIVSAMQSPDQLIQDIKTVFESDALQTRLRGGATAEARFLFEKYGGRPGAAAKISEASMAAINWMDSATTSFSAAIVYRSNLNEALAAGMPETLARETALDAASAAIYRFAQPVSFGQKSNVENSGNMLTKAFFLFMSDPRLKASIMSDAIRGLATGRGNKGDHIRRLVAVELMAVLSHVVASAYRDAFTDDDDEEIWSLGGWMRALALAPVQGYLFLGTMMDTVFSQLTGAGFFTPTQNPLVSVAQTGIRALKNADDILAFDDPDALLKEWVSIARMLAVTPTMAAPAVLLNTMKPIFGAVENAETPE